MSGTVLVVSSVTYAIKGRNILTSSGITASSRRIMKLTEKGCGWGIEVPYEKKEDAIQILESRGIKILKVMPAQGNGAQ